MRKRRAADLFCGGGGTTEGAESTGAVEVTFALNHWQVAVNTHSANFPNTRHVNSRLENTNPSECSKIDILFASPECTHHSRARGGRPTSDQQRSGAWYVLPWLEFHRPHYMVIENVIEFRDWGPVDSEGKPIKALKGSFFQAWIAAIRAYGYTVDWQVLNAADFGAATSRSRLFIIARRGKRAPVFPTPTHAKGGDGVSMLPWRPAYEVIDWTTPITSIFKRKRPLAEKTLLRLEAGLHRFVEPFVVQFRNNMDGADKDNPLSTITAGGRHHGLAVPFVAQWDNQGGGGQYVRGAHEPLPTQVTKANTGVAVPFLADVNHGDDGHTAAGRTHGLADTLGSLTTKNGRGIAVPFITPNFGEAPGQTPRTHDLGDALPTITSHGAGMLAVPFQYQLIGQGAGRSRPIDGSVPTIIATRENHGVAIPFISKQFGTHDGRYNPNVDLNKPLGTVTTKDHNALVIPWLIHYYGTNNQSHTGDPLDTITTKERHAIAEALCDGPADWPAPSTDAMRKLQDTMRALGVSDLAFRMLQNPELSLAQGFRPDYIFTGTKADITRQIGNSVSPAVARAISLIIAG